MERKRPAQLLLLVALAVVIGGVTLSSPASGAPASFNQKANRAVRDLVSPNLIRAEIVTFSAGEVGDYRVYRGVVRKMRGRLLTLAERDGAVVQIRLSPATQIRIDGRRSTVRRVRRGMRATMMRQGNAAASWLYIARRPPDRSGSKIRSLFSTDFVRAVVVSWDAGAVLGSRTDTGVIESSDEISLTLQENDGSTVPLQIDASTEVWINNTVSSPTELTAGMDTTTIGTGDGVVSQIWAYDKNSGAGKN